MPQRTALERELTREARHIEVIFGLDPGVYRFGAKTDTGLEVEHVRALDQTTRAAGLIG